MNLVIIIFVLIIVFVILCYLSKERYPNKFNNSLVKLVRQAARWSVAAEQDKSPLIAVLHANYGAGFLWAVKDIATADEIKKATNVDITILEKKIMSIQDAATKKLANLCPGYALDNNYLAAVAGDN